MVSKSAVLASLVFGIWGRRGTMCEIHELIFAAQRSEATPASNPGSKDPIRLSCRYAQIVSSRFCLEELHQLKFKPGKLQAISPRVMACWSTASRAWWSFIRMPVQAALDYWYISFIELDARIASTLAWIWIFPIYKPFISHRFRFDLFTHLYCIIGDCQAHLLSPITTSVCMKWNPVGRIEDSQSNLDTFGVKDIWHVLQKHGKAVTRGYRGTDADAEVWTTIGLFPQTRWYGLALMTLNEDV